MILLLKQSGWIDLQSKNTPGITSSMGKPKVIDVSEQQLKMWKRKIKAQELVIADARQNVLNPDKQSESIRPVSDACETVISDLNTLQSEKGKCHNMEITKQETPQIDLGGPQTIIDHVGKENSLNKKQWVAFRIIANHFVVNHIEGNGDKSQSDGLTMLMTGPGGTGKTHVMRSVRTVMEHYGCGHII